MLKSKSKDFANMAFSYQLQKNLVTILYAITMAWVEAAVVFYLRNLSGQMWPYPPSSNLLSQKIINVELVRELSTIIMLLCVGWISGVKILEKIGRFLIAFGVWDICYYIFLAIITGFPTSLFEWDILFLIPLPWWGPVFAPCAIAVLMVATGWLFTSEPIYTGVIKPTKLAIICSSIGIILALYTFMEDSIKGIFYEGRRPETITPEEYMTELFWLSWILMAIPFVQMFRGLLRQRGLF